MKPIELTTTAFTEKVGDVVSNPKDWAFTGDKPALVDFHAPWCSYCKRLSPILDELAEEYKGKIDFYTVDVDQEEPLETAFNIRTIPTVLLAKADGTRDMVIATMPKNELKQLIEERLLS